MSISHKESKTFFSQMGPPTLTQRLDRAETDAKAANDELKRLRSAFERPDEVIARYNEIEMPRISIEIKYLFLNANRIRLQCTSMMIYYKTQITEGAAHEKVIFNHFCHIGHFHYRVCRE